MATSAETEIVNLATRVRPLLALWDLNVSDDYVKELEALELLLDLLEGKTAPSAREVMG